MIRYDLLEAADFAEWGITEIPHPSRMVGFSCRRDGVLVAIGLAWVDENEHWWCGFRGAEGFPAGIHRAALELFDGLRRAKIRQVRAELDETIPKARDWLMRLGFAPEDKDEEVWIRGLYIPSSGPLPRLQGQQERSPGQ